MLVLETSKDIVEGRLISKVHLYLIVSYLFNGQFGIYFSLFYLDCVQVIAKEGTYFVRQKFGSTKACGIYIAGYHNETVRVDFIKVDVTYKDGGVVAVSLFSEY